MKRRTFLKKTTTTAAGAIVAGGGISILDPVGEFSSAFAHVPVMNPQISPRLTKFIDPLPIPRILRPVGLNHYEVRMTQFSQQLHSELPATMLWGYNGTYPGPTFETRTGQPITVTWINDLPLTHFLPGSGSDWEDGLIPEVQIVPMEKKDQTN